MRGLFYSVLQHLYTVASVTYLFPFTKQTQNMVAAYEMANVGHSKRVNGSKRENGQKWAPNRFRWAQN